MPKYRCQHCGAKQTNLYTYKMDKTGKSFQVAFSCGRVTTVHMSSNYRKTDNKPCPKAGL